MSLRLLSACALAALSGCAHSPEAKPSPADDTDPVHLDLHGDIAFDPDAPPVYELAAAPGYDRQLVYVDFTGPVIHDCSNYCSDATTNRSWVLGHHFGVSSLDFPPYGGGSSARDTVLDILRGAFADYDIDFTTTRPSSGPYTMLVISGDVDGPAAGVSPLDCDNRNPSDIAWVYLTSTASVSWVGQAAAHEVAHSLGLTHVENTADFLDWRSRGTTFTASPYHWDKVNTTCAPGAIQDAPEMLADTLGLRSGLPPWFEGTFSDDDGSPHEDNIESIAAAGITTGCSGGAAPKFCPSDPVTRGQMVIFLQRALGLVPTGADHFDDDDDAWFEAAANAAADAGITNGCATRTFCGNDPVTRAQMASFLVRALDLPPSSTDHFTDDDGSPHEDAINSLADAGITTGCGGGKYCPSDTVTRAQMASFLARALGL